MKCLVFSDSHGNIYYMNRALSQHPDAEVVFFLGDGIYDADAIRAMDTRPRMWIAVRGNCDFHKFFDGREARRREEITLESRKILLTHGDAYGVKSSLSHLEDYAKERGADIVLFGHTHTPTEIYVNEERPIYFFNPGSISSPSYSYGILTLGESVLFSHGSFA